MDEPDDLDALVAALTVEEQAALTAGADLWTTVPLPGREVPALALSDGPIGARGLTAGHESLTPSVAIPCGTALGATWDPPLVAEAAAVVARQVIDKGAQVLLAPTVNLHRHPLWGRSFECFSEDPLLSGVLGAAYVEGVQGEGVAATVKHLVANETEFERYTSSSDLDERTLRELYLLPFEHAVRRAGAWCVMTSYNRVGGRHVADQRRFVDELLREEWGFDGVVMSDWWALLDTEAAAGAGTDLEMPGPARAFGPALAAAVSRGAVDASLLASKSRRLLGLMRRVGLEPGAPGAARRGGAVRDERPQDRPEDRALCRRAAAESLVLLRNDGLLPLDLPALRRLAVVGPRADELAIMGGGSAKVRPHYRLSLVEALRQRCAAGTTVDHLRGEGVAGIGEAAAAASAADVTIVVVGTDEVLESEGYDRASMDLPPGQDALVAAVLAATSRAVVVVTSGAPVTMPWAAGAPALLQSFFGGQELANALVDVLSGEADPGGRLPTTLPERIEHTPAFGNFPGEASHVRYAEGLLVGYRWYDARRLPVAFPFGHGLSYSSFELAVQDAGGGALAPGEHLRIAVRVTNTGDRAGSEVVQCYLAPPAGTSRPGGRLRPPKELRAFAKVRLGAGASTTVQLELGPRAFAYYDTADSEWPALSARRHQRADVSEQPIHRTRAGWYVDTGTYEVLIGRSSADISCRFAVEVRGGEEPLDASLLPG